MPGHNRNKLKVPLGILQQRQLYLNTVFVLVRTRYVLKQRMFQKPAYKFQIQRCLSKGGFIMGYPGHTEHLLHRDAVTWADDNNSLILFFGGCEPEGRGLAGERVAGVWKDKGNNVIYRFNLGFLEKALDLFAKCVSVCRVPSASKCRTQNHLFRGFDNSFFLGFGNFFNRKRGFRNVCFPKNYGNNTQ